MDEYEPIYQTVTNTLAAPIAVTQACFEAEMYVRTSADGEDGDGAAGVREPRRPLPAAPAGSMALVYSG